MKHMVSKENNTYRYEISDRRVLYKTECFFQKNEGDMETVLLRSSKMKVTDE